MDPVICGGRENEVDLESGGSDEDRTNDQVFSNRLRNNNLLNSFWSGILCTNGSVNSLNHGEVSDENVELLADKNLDGEDDQQHMAFLDKKRAEEKRNTQNFRKPPKPPRPPKGPLLDAADQKLVQEIAELAMRKRVRIERIKALKKMRAAKASSCNSSVSAMIITVLFLVIIIFQGFCSRNSGSMLFQGSPEPATATNEDLISVEFYKNFSTYDDVPGTGYPSLAEGQVPQSGLRKK